MFDAVQQDAGEESETAPEVGPSGTPAAAALAATLLAVYCLQLAFDAIEGTGLIRMGATTPLIWDRGHIWTLASSTLLHIGFFHLICNAYFAWIVGRQVERAAGPWRMLVVFFVGGLTGSTLSVLVSPDVVSAGASGGNWGLMVAQLLLVTSEPLRRGEAPTEKVSSILTLIVLNGAISVLPGINGLAHLGGGLGGAAVLVLSHWGGRFWALPAVALGLLHAAALAMAINAGDAWHWWEPPDLVDRELLDGAVLASVPDLPAGPKTQGVQMFGDGLWDALTVEYRIYISDEDPAATGDVFAESLGVPAVEQVCDEPCQSWLFEMPGGVMITSVRDYESIVMQTTVTVWTSRRPYIPSGWEMEIPSTVRFTQAGVDMVRLLATEAEEAGDAAVASRTREQLLLDHPDAKDLLNEQAWLLATATDDARRDGARAVELAKRAVAQDDSAPYLDTLATAYVEVGDLDLAIATQRRAMELDPENPRFKERLELFESLEP